MVSIFLCTVIVRKVLVYVLIFSVTKLILCIGANH